MWSLSEETDRPNVDTMPDQVRIGLRESLRTARTDGDADFLKEGIRVLGRR